jgi:hypothetical protein
MKSIPAEIVTSVYFILRLSHALNKSRTDINSNPARRGKITLIKICNSLTVLRENQNHVSFFLPLLRNLPFLKQDLKEKPLLPESGGSSR